MWLRNCLNYLTLPMLLPQSSCVYMANFRSVVPGICVTRVLFLAFVGLTQTLKRGVSLWTFLERTPGDTESKYVWVHGYSYLGPSIL